MRTRAVFVSFILISAGAAVAGWTASRAGTDRPGIVPDTDTPQILAFDVTPKNLKNNRVNFIQLYFKFSDGMANLKGGVLNINFVYKSAAGESLFIMPPASSAAQGESEPRLGAVVAPDGHRPTFITYPLTESVFNKKTGEFRLWFGLLAENFSSIKIFIWLKDGDGTTGLESPEATLVRSRASSGPKQGRQVGQLGYDFTLLDKANNRKKLSAHRGKVVLVNFSAMWCKYCKAEAAELQALYLRYRGRGFMILNVLNENYENDPIRPSDCKTWAEAYGMTFPVLADLFLGVYDSYNAFPNKHPIPSNVLIDRTGKIRWKKLSYLPAIKAQMEAKIQQLLAE